LGQRLAVGWSNLKDDGRYLLTFPRRRTRKGVVTASAVGAGVVLLVFLDDEIREEVQEERSRSLDRWERRIEHFGHARNTALGALAVYGGGRLFHSERAAETGRCLVEALVFTEGFTLTAKGALGREQPGEGTRASDFFEGGSFFPSGHTARAFAFATVLAERHGRPASLIAYPVATLVGLSRMERDVHWASDVLAGAALGHFVARAIVERRGARRPAPRPVTVSPVLLNRGRETGVVIRIQWG
jgi:membrane-associated phospholipid phosphatase